MAQPAQPSFFRTELLERRRRLESALTAQPRAEDLSRLLADVDGALARLDQGTFGLCETCRDPIEPERLMADPLTRFCLDHLDQRERQALEQDLALSARIQAALLPSAEAAAGDWESHFRYVPASVVSGDYCDIIRPDNGEGLFFAAGDISGKGVAASLLMSHLHAIFRSLVSVGMPLMQAMSQANRLFCESTLPSSYATLACGWARHSGEVELCNAGHCPALVVRRDGVSVIESSGLPLGMFCSSQYPAVRCRLEPGDCLVLYTDGVTEARSRDGAEYGMDRLIEALAAQRGATARQLAAAIAEDLENFRAGVPRADDVLILAVRRMAVRQ
ncbi:MAG: SpoIIE family protein phosphatase [Bryobacteraceae bacterium]|nr:SpoIIE family protein phosphatase [Bryobacteraceae bacterium]